MDKVSRELSPTITAVTSGYTPGPWTVDARGDVCAADGSFVVGEFGIELPDDFAIIAAAPELLEALRELYLKTVVGTDAERHTALEKAWAAISKAEGGTLSSAEQVDGRGPGIPQKDPA